MAQSESTAFQSQRFSTMGCVSHHPEIPLVEYCADTTKVLLVRL